MVDFASRIAFETRSGGLGIIRPTRCSCIASRIVTGISQGQSMAGLNATD